MNSTLYNLTRLTRFITNKTLVYPHQVHITQYVYKYILTLTSNPNVTLPTL